MTGDELKALRTAQGWSQAKMGEMLSGPLDRKYGSAAISKWEKGQAPVPKIVSTYLEQLGLEPKPAEGVEYEPPADEYAPADTMPPPPPGEEQRAKSLPLVIGSSEYATVCAEMFEVLATAVGMVGAITGNEKLQQDGRIILDDKQNLGKAYWKLAETNPTFARMLTGVTSGGAVLQVALVTGITAGKILRNHQTPASVELPDDPQPAPGSPEAMLHVVPQTG